MKPKKVPMLTTPNGGVAARCQATNRRGEQCGRPARQGFAVCGGHGAGYAAREESGEKRPVGRPTSHGLYSRTVLKDLRDLREEVESLQLDLTDTDAELVSLKAVTWFLLAQAEKMNTKADMLESAVAAVEATLVEATIVKVGGELGAGELTVAQAREVAAGLAQGYKLLSAISSWTDRLLDSNLKVLTAVKTRAEIRAKLAEEEATAHFAELAKRITSIIWAMADDEFIDAYEARLDRDIFTPIGLKLPEPASA